MPINARIKIADALFALAFRDVGGSATIMVSLAELERYNLNPDAYAAVYFDMPVSDYIEWITLDGAPLCGGTTKAGKSCRQPIGHAQMSSPEWLAKHRASYCTVHGGS